MFVITIILTLYGGAPIDRRNGVQYILKGVLLLYLFIWGSIYNYLCIYIYTIFIQCF